MAAKIKWHPDMEHNDVAVTLLSAIVSSNLAAAIPPTIRLHIVSSWVTGGASIVHTLFAISKS